MMMLLESQDDRSSLAGSISHQEDSLKVCIAETDAQVRQQVFDAIEQAGHSAILATQISGRQARHHLGDAEPPDVDVLVGCSTLLREFEPGELPGSPAASLLLARPSDTAFLPVFMRANPSNDFAVLPQSEESLRACIGSFLQRQQRRLMLRSSSFGKYLFIKETLQVFYEKKAVKLSPCRFSLAETLFRNIGVPVSNSTLYSRMRIANRQDITYLVDANVALLSHLLELDGSHGYCLRRASPTAYCLEPTRVALSLH